MSVVRTTKGLIALLAVFFLTGCSLFFGLHSDYSTFYRMPTAVPAASAPGSPLSYRLVVPDARAAGFIDSNRIVFRKGSYEEGAYQFASWVEPPAQQLTTMILEGIRKDRVFVTVSRAGAGVTGDLQLNLELRDFSHRIDETPGIVRIVLVADLVDLGIRQSIGQRIFEEEHPADTFDSSGAVAAMSTLSVKIARAVADWTEQTAAGLNAPQS